MTVTTPDPASTGFDGHLGPIPTSRHIMGTTRMGTDPAGSVCDPGAGCTTCPNVLIADSSPFVTATGYGPTLTIVALALRNARHLAGERPAG